MGLFRDLLAGLTNASETPMLPTITVDAREYERLQQDLRIYKQLAEQNAGRARLVETPRHDYADPQYKDYKEYLDGNKRLTQDQTIAIVNHWTKFREMLEIIVEAYWLAFKAGDYDTGLFYDLEIRILEISHAVNFSVTEVLEDQVRIETVLAEDCWMPLEFIWEDWRAKCDAEMARKETLRNQKAEEDAKKYQEYQHQRQQERYREAKRVVQEFEKGKDPG